MIGHTLGHFEILEKIGEGGMGVVYKARDAHLDRLVAIKILPADKVADHDRRRRFAQEAKAASALNHPGIVTIHDITQHEGIDFIAMEFVPGRTLDRMIPRHGLGLKEMLDYAVQIAEALAAAHAAGIVHRDLKPANVIVTDQGRIKVLDFGLAKLVDRVGLPAWDDAAPTATRAAPVTDQGAIVGTVAYMAPEQAEGKTVDARADIFSFGSVLYEMVTGQRAFRGDSPLSTLTAVLREEPKPISAVSEGLPRELERVITRCLRKDPERRWQSMADVNVALRELKDESDSGALPAEGAPVRRRRRVWAAAAALTFVVAAGVIGAFVWRDRAVVPDRPAVSFNAIPLTTYPGREQQASFSPDGNSVAFSWNGETEENWDIYVKLIGPGTPQRMTTDPAIDLSPAWSPDGRSIAFGRFRGGRLVVVVVPSRGGPEREVFETFRPGGLGVGQILSWSADSRMLVVGTSPSADRPIALTAVDVATGGTRQITTPSDVDDDALPAVSPDGRMLAFVRHSGTVTAELYVQALSAGFEPIGEPRRLGGARAFYHGVAWGADGRDVIVSSGNRGNIGLWRVPLQGEQRERLSPFGDECRQPTVAMQQNRLAFTRASWDENIWRLALSVPGRSAGTPVRLSGSTRAELNAQFSPDGTRVAFESQRSGAQELWVADRDGRNALQLTSFNGRLGGTPAWSPDGQSIAFDLRNEDGRRHLHHSGTRRRTASGHASSSRRPRAKLVA